MPDILSFVLQATAVLLNAVALMNLLTSQSVVRETERQMAAAFRLVAMLEALAVEDELFDPEGK